MRYMQIGLCLINQEKKSNTTFAMKTTVLFLFLLLSALIAAFAQDTQFFTPYPAIEATFECYKVTNCANCVIVYVKGEQKHYKCIKEKMPFSNINIHEDHKYKMVIQSVFPQKLGDHECMGPGTTGFTSINLEGNLINIEPENGIWDLHWIIEIVDLSDSTKSVFPEFDQRFALPTHL